MILTIDVGNSNVVVGVFRGDDMVASWRLATDHERMPDEWWSLLRGLANAEGIDLRTSDGAIVGSVVPRLTSKITSMIQHRIGIDPIVLSTSIDLGINVAVDIPEEAGADRLANAVAVQKLYKAPAIVVDFGTATTFDVVAADGSYIGGAIAPGVQLALEALTGRAARLSAVALALPDSAIGHNTIHSVQSGTVLGYLDLVNGMLQRISQELSGEPAIVATGGLGQMFNEHSPLIDAYEPDLTIRGLLMIYRHVAGI